MWLLSFFDSLNNSSLLFIFKSSFPLQTLLLSELVFLKYETHSRSVMRNDQLKQLSITEGSEAMIPHMENFLWQVINASLAIPSTLSTLLSGSKRPCYLLCLVMWGRKIIIEVFTILWTKYLIWAFLSTSIVVFSSSFSCFSSSDRYSETKPYADLNACQVLKQCLKHILYKYCPKLLPASMFSWRANLFIEVSTQTIKTRVSRNTFL